MCNLKKSGKMEREYVFSFILSEGNIRTVRFINYNLHFQKNRNIQKMEIVEIENASGKLIYLFITL